MIFIFLRLSPPKFPGLIVSNINVVDTTLLSSAYTILQHPTDGESVYIHIGDMI